jgi:ABC-type transport system involved in multi-copper enzyme maturation permease subunit
VPPLIGAFVGAPLLARELEAGTLRFAWTQGLERWRWTLAKLAALGLVVTVAAGALSVLFSWYYQPYLAASNQALELSGLSPFGGGVFDLRGVSLAAWTLTAFAIGALAGVLIRRVVPAIVATLAAYSGLALIAANLLRQHYLTPLLSSNVNLPGSSWIIRQYWTQGGTFAFTSSRAAPQSLVHACSGAPPGPLGKPPVQAFAQCAAQHGYTRLTSYQPASRFWPFQWIEGGWLLVLSALLIAVTVWLVHRRAA